MADPLAIAAGVAGLLALAGDVLGKCYTYGCAVASAPKEMRKLVEEMTTLSGILVGLQGLVSADNLAVSQKIALSQSIRDCHLTLREVLDTLDTVKPESKRQKIGSTINRLLWPLKQKETLALLGRLERNKSALTFALTTDTASGVQKTQIVVTEVLQTLEEDISQRKSKEALEERRETFQWLTKTDYEAMHNRASALQFPGTGTWLLESEELQSWLRGDLKFLWMSGIPGSGKTIMTSTILNQCVLPRCSGNELAAYFYCDFRETGSQLPECVLGAITAQLCERNPQLFTEVEDSMRLNRNEEGKLRDPSLEELERLLVKVLDLCPSVTVVIDALDECLNRNYLLDFLPNLSTKTMSDVRILVTSRREVDIQRALIQFPHISVQSKAADEDIQRYVVATMAFNPKFNKLTVSLKDFIISSLCQGAGGMFRWVQCQLDELSRLRTNKAIREALKSLPKNLDETYERILHRIDEADAAIARRALMWLAVASRPLKVIELAETAIIEIGIRNIDPESRLHESEDVLEICGSLIRYDNVEVVLAHNSVRDYLTSTRASRSTPLYHLTQDSANNELAKLCLTYLLLDDFRTGPCRDHEQMLERLRSYPLLQYSAQNWAHHAANSLERDPELLDLTMRLIRPRPTSKFKAWVQIMCIKPRHIGSSFNRYPRNAAPLYYASSFGLAPVVKRLLEDSVDVDAPGGRTGGSALHAACWREHPETVRLLLKAGADPHLLDRLDVTPLNHAEWTGNKEIIELFKKHCNIELKSNPEGNRGRNPRTIR